MRGSPAGRTQKHRHDTYAIGLTDRGVQIFDYRGSARASMPGQVVVLYPDEVHDGRAGTDEGFGYRIVYVEPSRLAEALRVAPRTALSAAVRARARVDERAGCRAPSREPFGPRWIRWRPTASSSTWPKAAGRRAGGGRPARPRVDAAPSNAPASFSTRSEPASSIRPSWSRSPGLTRYDLARQFRLMFGTSPYRYLLMRRLDFARQRIHQARPLVDVAVRRRIRRSGALHACIQVRVRADPRTLPCVEGPRCAAPLTGVGRGSACFRLRLMV